MGEVPIYRLVGGRYTNPGHLLDDIALTFHNALSYNPETDMVPTLRS